MDLPPPTSKTPPAAVAPNRRPMRRFLALSLSLFVVLVVLFLVFASPNTQFAWMTPAQFAQASRPGPLALLKYKVIRLAGPLMRFYHHNRPYILIDAIIMKFPLDAAAQTGFGPPNATNESGMREWILSPAEMVSFRLVIQTNMRNFVIGRPRIQTASGVPSILNMGQTFVAVPGFYTNIGTTILATATASSGSVQMLLGASSTELLGQSITNGLKTNFFTACRAFVPDAGALAINCRNADATNPTNYWLIVSPVVVDATGKPIKK